MLFSRTKSAADAVGTLKKGEWADVKVKIADGASAGLTAGMLVKVEELTPDLSRVRLFHTSVSRAIASWPSWPGESGFSGDFAEYLAQKFPTSTAADFAILEAGVTSEETYTEQGLYWKTGHLPMLEYVVKTYKPDLLLAGMPTTDEFQHQFLGLVSPKLPGGAANPAYDDVDLNGKPDGRVAAREGFIRTAYEEADEVLTRARELMGKDPTTFVALRPRLRAAVPRDRREPAAGRDGAPLEAADLELSARNGRDHRQGQGLLGRRDRPDLPEPRRPRPRGRRASSRSPRPTPRARSPRSRRSTRASPTRRTGRTTGSPRAGR